MNMPQIRSNGGRLNFDAVVSAKLNFFSNLLNNPKFKNQILSVECGSLRACGKMYRMWTIPQKSIKYPMYRARYL